MEKEIINFLMELGVPAHLKGFQYLVDAIEMSISNSLVCINKGLYINIARKYQEIPSRVERAIRHAIEIVWVKVDERLIEKIFKNSLDANKNKPTNAQFIKTVALYLKNDNTRIERN